MRFCLFKKQYKNFFPVVLITCFLLITPRLHPDDTLVQNLFEITKPSDNHQDPLNLIQNNRDEIFDTPIDLDVVSGSNDVPADINDLDNMTVTATPPPTTSSTLTAKPTHSDIVACLQILTDQQNFINIIPILKGPLYLRTHPLATRNVLDLPVFNFLASEFNDTCARVDFFYNFTPEAKFTETGTTIDSYIALQDEQLLRAIKNALTDDLRQLLASQHVTINIPPLLGFFSRMKIQQRQAGVMLSTRLTVERLHLGLKLPVVYLERNFHLTDSEIDAINRAHIFGISINKDGPLSPFTRQYLIADRFGLGDLRAQILYSASDNPLWNYCIGAEITAPIHTAFKRGIIGGSFEKIYCKPELDICELINLILKKGAEGRDQVTQTATNFFLGALYQLSANLLDEADARPWGLALVSTSEIHFTPWLKLNSRMALEYLTPYHGLRYFTKRRDTIAFDAREFDDEAQAENNMNFINNQFIDKLYPEVLRTHVIPGLVFKQTSLVTASRGNWSLSVGSDLWLHGKEKLEEIHTRIHNLDIAKATRDESYQSKLLAAIKYTKETKARTLYFTCAADTTYDSQYLGDDSTLLVGIETTF